jgi:RimJ/RimL family protein N-acetyltransferase
VETTTTRRLNLEGERVVLRRWRASDVAPFAEMCADPEVMRFFPKVATAEESAAFVERAEAHLDAHGFGLWAVEVPGELAFAGYVGLAVVGFVAPFAAGAGAGGRVVEAGWRLARGAWGKGYAVDGARVALCAGFEVFGLPEVVSFTVPANVRSRRVMERLGMRRCVGGDFEHPMLPVGHALRVHVLFRMTRDEWGGSAAAAPRSK